jgi:hypothetical protein
MAIGKRGSRPLVLDGRHFRWRCEFNDPLEIFSVAFTEGRITTPDRLIVRPVDGPHRVLAVAWAPCKGPVVTPELVRRCVEEALRRGWLSERPSLELAGAEAPVRSEGHT